MEYVEILICFSTMEVFMNTQLKLHVRWYGIAMLLVVPLHGMSGECSLSNDPICEHASSRNTTNDASTENSQIVSLEQLLQDISEVNPYHARLLQLKSEFFSNTSTIQDYIAASTEDKEAIIYAIEQCFPFLMEQAAQEIRALNDAVDADEIAFVEGNEAIDGDFELEKDFDTVLKEIDQVRNDDDDDEKTLHECVITSCYDSTSKQAPSPSMAAAVDSKKS